MTVGDVFARIGGFSLGMERAGHETKWAVEVDRYCRAVLERHFPSARLFGDVRLVGAHNLEPVEIMTGGFPCQDLSAAGTGKALAGSRSGLWSELARLVGELRPRYLIVENVPQLYSKKPGLDVVLGDLHALGYDAEWDCLPAAAFGAPHLRDRIWLVAYPRQEGCEGPGHASQGRSESGRHGGEGITPDADEVGRIGRAGRQSRRREGSEGSGSAMADSAPHRRGTRVFGRAFGTPGSWSFGGLAGSDPWASEPGVGRVAHGIPRRVDRVEALGNSIVPQIAEFIGRRLTA